MFSPMRPVSEELSLLLQLLSDIQLLNFAFFTTAPRAGSTASVLRLDPNF
jgi:hypothetical protein